MRAKIVAGAIATIALSGLLVSAFVSGQDPAFSGRQQPPRPDIMLDPTVAHAPYGQRWEYLVDSTYANGDELQAQLNAKGIMGWELVSMVSSSGRLTTVFKRPFMGGIRPPLPEVRPPQK